MNALNIYLGVLKFVTTLLVVIFAVVILDMHWIVMEGLAMVLIS